MSVPKLRFTGFPDDWNIQKLKNIATITTGSTPSTFVEEYYNGERLFVSPADLQGNRFITSTKTTVTELGFLQGRKINKGSILFVCIGSTIGKIAINKTDCITNQQINAITCNEKNTNAFLYSLLQKNGKRIKRLAGKQAVPQINKSEFSDLKFSFPYLQEQEKIASFFTVIDQKLNLLKEKKEKLELYKKGVMQQIFSQKLRFKDEKGKEFPEWEEKRLGSIGTTISGLSGKAGDDFGEGEFYIQYKQIFDDSKIDISRFGRVKISKNEKQTKVKYGDVLFTTSSETPNEIGTSSVLLDHVENLYLNSFCFGFRPNSLIETLPNYLRFLFRSNHFRIDLMKLAQGSTRFNMSKTEFLKLTTKLPSSAEQQKIADFLSALDTKINLVSIQIEKTELWKKGLLQQMFV